MEGVVNSSLKLSCGHPAQVEETARPGSKYRLVKLHGTKN